MVSLVFKYMKSEISGKFSRSLFLPLLHGGWRMIEPGKITDNSFVITMIAFADLHGGDLCQAHFQVPPESVLMQRLTASLHMALDHRFGGRKR